MENLFINGAFSDALWSWLRQHGTERVECPGHTQTFAAARWKIRYASRTGRGVTQQRCSVVPPGSTSRNSLQVNGASELDQTVFFGQRIEMAESPRYRTLLTFSAWIYLEADPGATAPLFLEIGTANSPDIFGTGLNSNTTSQLRERVGDLSSQGWTFISHTFDATDFSPNGLSVEMEFAPEMLNQENRFLRIADCQLQPGRVATSLERLPVTFEKLMAQRFYQSWTVDEINNFGRPNNTSPHEIYFIHYFPQMRIPPQTTFSQDNSQFQIISSSGGTPQTGFSYDVPFCSHGSIAIRASKRDHGLHDASMVLIGPPRGAFIALNAEL
jgi:hypothetical protein